MIPAQQNINKPGTAKRVLVAPLDWGLGHATRCIPIIRELLVTGFEVFLAAEKSCAALLQKEFPALTVLPLPGYRVTYTVSARLFWINMICQVPKISSAIRREHRWLRSVAKEYFIDTVISDNRFGMYNKDVHSVFITHQLHIKTGNRFTEKIAQLINYRYINRFDECWVPDAAGEENLAGVLSHPEAMPTIPVKYIGALSRFVKKETEHSMEVLIMLSGPEPQRTVLEKILLPWVAKLKLKTTIVRGLPFGENAQIPSADDSLTVFDHLPGHDLERLIAASKIVVARSGYTTVMELAALQKKAILIPTPGQSEQEYLAKYLAEKNFCITANQKYFDLEAAVKELTSGEDIGFPMPQGNLSYAVRSLL